MLKFFESRWGDVLDTDSNTKAHDSSANLTMSDESEASGTDDDSSGEAESDEAEWKHEKVGRHYFPYAAIPRL